jgi:hypothetical protein
MPFPKKYRYRYDRLFRLHGVKLSLRLEIVRGRESQREFTLDCNHHLTKQSQCHTGQRRVVHVIEVIT